MTYKRKDVWEEAKEHAIAGRAPVITLSPGHYVVTPKQKPGRPRVQPEGTEHFGYPLQTPQGKRMRCRNPGCDKRLWKNTDTIVCSDACRDELTHRCKTMLEILEGRKPATDLDVYYRGKYVRRRAS